GATAPAVPRSPHRARTTRASAGVIASAARILARRAQAAPRGWPTSSASARPATRPARLSGNGRAATGLTATPIATALTGATVSARRTGGTAIGATIANAGVAATRTGATTRAAGTT